MVLHTMLLCSQVKLPAVRGFQPACCPPAPLQSRCKPPRAAQVDIPAVSVHAHSLEKFASAASGEFEGVSATFNAEGQASELPEHFVPAAYREWEVKLFDWQTQCSAEATKEGLHYTMKRLMPTVGVQKPLD